MSSGNAYVLQIKGNQPLLRAHIQARHAAEPAPAAASHWQHERRNGRRTMWQTSVYVCHDAALQAAWAGLTRFVVVEKTVTYRGHTRTHQRYYITSLRTSSAAQLAAGIRGHWGIENKLHRTRDVHFGQDANQLRHPVGAANMALLNTLALNHLLTMDLPSVSSAQISFAQNIKQFLTNLRT